MPSDTERRYVTKPGMGQCWVQDTQDNRIIAMCTRGEDCRLIVAKLNGTEEMLECRWWEDDDPVEGVSWHTVCGNRHIFLDGGPTENGYKFCPYCRNAIGKAMVEVE